jgi:hypothetical protein
MAPVSAGPVCESCTITVVACGVANLVPFKRPSEGFPEHTFPTIGTQPCPPRRPWSLECPQHLSSSARDVRRSVIAMRCFAQIPPHPRYVRPRESSLIGGPSTKPPRANSSRATVAESDASTIRRNSVLATRLRRTASSPRSSQLRPRASVSSLACDMLGGGTRVVLGCGRLRGRSRSRRRRFRK